MKKTSYLILLVGALLFLQNCNKKERVAGYIKVEGFNVQNTNANFGTTSSSITDVWAYTNGEFLGMYQLPATIPIISDESQLDILFYPGIKVNGIASTRGVYPYYKVIRDTVPFASGQTTNVGVLSTEYLSTTQVLFNETFEFGNDFFEDLDGNTETSINAVNADVFEGNKSGYIELAASGGASNTTIEVASTTIVIPQQKKVFLELNYKNNIPFTIGLVGYDNNGAQQRTPYYGVNTKDTWNKVYFDIGKISNQFSNTNFKLYLQAERPSDVTIGKIYLDNVKLIYQ